MHHTRADANFRNVTMHLYKIKRTSHDIPFGLIYGTIALLALIAARLLPVQDMLPSCAFKAFTGIPCPTCGTTRSLICLAHGDLPGAIGLNPVASLAIIAAILLFVHDMAALISGSRITVSVTLREARWISSGAAVALLADWIYLAANL